MEYKNASVNCLSSSYSAEVYEIVVNNTDIEQKGKTLEEKGYHKFGNIQGNVEVVFGMDMRILEF